MTDLSHVLLPRGTNPMIGDESGRRPPDTGIAVYRSPHGSVRYVAYEMSAPVAGLQLVQIARNHAKVATVYTAPPHRRKGHAQRLLARAHRDFKTIDHAEHLTDDGAAWAATMKRQGPRSRILGGRIVK